RRGRCAVAGVIDPLLMDLSALVHSKLLYLLRWGGQARIQKGGESSMLARTAILRIDNEGKVVWLNARPVHLTPKEYRLLLLLSSQLGRVFSREEILEYVWPERDDAVDP